MGKFTNNVDPAGSSQLTTITTFDVVDDINITNLTATTLDISEGINSEGLIKANEGEFESVILGDIKIQNNIISLSDESILEEIILNANKITLSSDGADINLAKISTNELEISDSLITLALENTETNVDRGIFFNYPVSILTDSSGFRSGFIGMNNDNIFRLVTGISTITDNNFYNNGVFTLGTLEIGSLLINNINNNSSSDNLTISTSGNLNLLSTDNDNSVIIGNGLDSKTVINSNLEIKGTLEAETFAFFNSNVSTYARKNLLLFLDNSVKIDNISESNGIYTLTLNEDRVFTLGGYIYFEGVDISNSSNQTYLDKFNGIHTIQSVSADFLSITIELESGLDIPSFSNDVYALIGSLNSESLTNNSGLSVLSYEDSSKVLREHKINYEYDSNNYLDSSWLFNRNLKTENTILLKNNKIYYDNNNDYSRIYVKDDGELYFKNNNNYEHKLTNQDEDDIFNLNHWAITNDEILHTFNNVTIGGSTMSDFYKLSVKGNVEITGQLDALSGNLVANNIDASGSLSVNGFKSTNINTQNLTIEDRSFQIGYLDVSLINSVDEDNNEIKSRIDHKLETDTYIYFQNTNVYFSNGDSIDGFRKINVLNSTSLQIYDDNGLNISNIYYLTVNSVKYIGLKNLVGSDIINNKSTEFTGSDAIRVRIFMLSDVTFKYSYDGGYIYQDYTSDITLDTNIVLDFGIIISFLDNSNLENGDYFEFDCCPQYIISKDDTGALIEPDETNFLGEFGKVFSSNELLDSGFEVMIRNPNSYTLESQKLSYYYIDSNDKYWRLTDNLYINGSLNLKIDTSSINFGVDDDISLTHVHDTGLLLNQDKKLLYGSLNEYIYGDGSNLFINSFNNLNINSSDGIINIGNDNVDTNINIGTSTSARTITIGADESTKIDINALLIELDSSGTIVTDSTSTTTMTSDGNFSIDANNNANINIGTSSDSNYDKSSINIGTSTSARTITIGANESTKVDINAQIIDIDANGILALDSASGINIGTTSDVAVDIDSSTLDIDASGDITIDTTSNSATALTLTTNGGVSEQIVITNTLGTNSAAIDINASAGGIDIDANDIIAIDSASGINIGTTSDVAVDIDSSTLDIDASGDITIDTTSNSATALTLTTNGGVSEQIVITNTLGTNSAAIDINASAGGIDIDANGILAIDSASGINIGTTSDVAIDIDSSTLDIGASGDITIDTTSNSATALTLTTNGGVSEQIVITNTLGTNSAAIDINASAGGIDIDANGILALDSASSINIGTTSDVAIDIDSSTLDIDASGDITIDTTSNSATALTLTTNGGVSEKIVITNTFGTNAAAIDINALAGGIDIDANGIIAIDSASGINIGTTSDVAIDIDSSTLDIDASGDITIDTTSNSATALTLTTNGGVSEKIVITNTFGTNVAAIDINALAGGIDIDANGIIAIDSASGINIGTTSDVAIDIDSSTLDIDASGDITIDTTSNSATALTLTTNGGVSEQIVITNTLGTNSAAIDINALAGGIDIDANGIIAIDSASGINIGTTSDVAIDIDSSTLDIDASGDITIDTTSNSATALTLTTNGGVNEKIVITNTLGTNAAAIDINASVGGIDIDANGILALDSASGINIGTTSDVAVDIDASTLAIDSSDTTNLTMKVNDSSNKTLSISASNIGSGSSNLDINADGIIAIDGESGINIGTTNDVAINIDASTLDIDASNVINIDTTDTSNGINIGTATSGVPISIGHSTSEVTINDNLNIIGTMNAATGSTIGNLTLANGSITDSSGTISFGDGNITNVGLISCDSIIVDDSSIGLDLVFGGVTTTNKISLTNNLADALNITQESNSYLKFVTTNNSEEIVFGKDTIFNGVVTADAGVKVDNITIDGNEIDLSSGDLTIDVDSKIILDADGGDIFLKDGGTQYGSLTNLNDNLVIKSGTTTAVTFNDANVTFAGTINSGDITSNGIIKTTDTTGSSSSTSGSLQVAGGVGIVENAYIGGNLFVIGDMTINGTTTTVNSNTVTIDDPIITLGGDTVLESNDDKDRGIEFRYYDDESKLGFIGYDNDTSKFVMLTSATNSSEIFSGTTGTLVANIDGTINTATQNSITTMTGLTSLGSSGVTTTLSGPILASEGLNLNEQNITNIGSISCDSIIVDDFSNGLDIIFGGSSTTNKISLSDNLADALNITQGSNSYLKFVTTDDSEQIIFGENSTFSGTTIADLGSVTTADINGGTIDGVTIATSDITVGSDKKLNISDGILILADNQISGDKVEGGIINATTITTLESTTGNITTINSTTVDTTNIEVTNIKAKNGIESATIADSGIITIPSSVLTTTDINGGTLSDITIDGNWTAASQTCDNLGIVTTADINGGTIDGVTIATSDITVGSNNTLDVSNGTLRLANDQISGDAINGGTIGSIIISQLAGAIDCNNQAMTNVDINSGTIDGVDITMDSNNTLNVSNGTLTTSSAQNLAIVQGASSNINIGNFSFTAQTLTDGSASLNNGVLSGLSRIDGDIDIGDTSSQLGFFGATKTSKTEIDNLDSLGSSVLDTSSTPTNDNLNDLREDIVLIHNKLDNLIDALQSLGLI